MSKPRIAMTTWRRTMPTFLSDETDLYTLGAEYPAAVADAGAVPVLLAHYEAADAARVLEGFDGLVMVGGDDVHPERYGHDDIGTSKGVSQSADNSDLALARAAIELELPLFAICRGCQILNVAMGGTLHQEITDGDGLHRPISDVPADVLGERHPIVVTPGSRLAKAYGRDGERMVNSIHHQSIATIAPGFHCTAWSPDGIVEAIEPDDPDRPVLAVQWHPEKITAEGDHALFRYFVTDLVGKI
jgi:putative glutamine amidotransferase